MGGNAIIIKGVADGDAITRDSGILRRLFGRVVPREMELGNGQVHIDLPAKNFQALGLEFRAHLKARLPDPWPATKYLLDYLKMAAKVYVRGLREGEAETDWYVQLTFSGCGGMAQTSSDLAEHWARTWFREEIQAVSALLESRGFEVHSLDDPEVEDLLFLPLGGIGYASFSPSGWPSEGEKGQSHFEVDGGVEEIDHRVAEDLLAYLEKNLGPEMKNGRCRCQLCCPGLDRSYISGLPGVVVFDRS